ncbi:hypothetical protein [Actinomadura formosensis]|uniref:hypothetical protein n=1 Tax=Actinomadura formosensis TaxID=60706 RepID=UPI003D8E4C4C
MPGRFQKLRVLRVPLAVAGLAGLLGSAVVLGETGGGDPADAVRANARLVHCLSDRQRPALVKTAIRLGEAAPGSTDTAFRPVRDGRVKAVTTLDRWSEQSPGAFTRACKPLAALTAAKTLQDPAPKPPLWRRILTNPVVTLLLGSALTFATTWSAARTARRQTLTDQLVTAAAEYLKAAQAVRLARAREKPSDEAGLEGRRVDLGTAILRAGLPGAERHRLGALLSQAHETLIRDEFRREAAEKRLRLLETGLGRAVRGEPVPGDAPAGADTEPAEQSAGGRP